MMDQKLPSQTRLTFLDNLRYFFVISVVLLPAANSYSHGALHFCDRISVIAVFGSGNSGAAEVCNRGGFIPALRISGQ